MRWSEILHLMLCQERDETFDNNIAEEIDENDLNKKAQDLIGYFDSDKESRSC